MGELGSSQADLCKYTCRSFDCDIYTHPGGRLWQDQQKTGEFEKEGNIYDPNAVTANLVAQYLPIEGSEQEKLEIVSDTAKRCEFSGVLVPESTSKPCVYSSAYDSSIVAFLISHRLRSEGNGSLARIGSINHGSSTYYATTPFSNHYVVWPLWRISFLLPTSSPAAHILYTYPPKVNILTQIPVAIF